MVNYQSKTELLLKLCKLNGIEPTDKVKVFFNDVEKEIPLERALLSLEKKLNKEKETLGIELKIMI